jgi:GntR family transcriptional regulator
VTGDRRGHLTNRDRSTDEAGRTKHADLRDELVALLDSGLRPHDPLPSERELRERFGVSRSTVRHALAELVDRGRIYRVHGRGTFVAVPIVRKDMNLASFSEDMAARGLVAGSKIIRVENDRADAVVAQALALSPGEPVVCIKRVRLANGEPMCLEEVHIPELIVGNLAFGLGEHDSLFETLRDRLGVRIVKADQEVRATVLSNAEAELLGVPPFSPALLISRVTYDDRGRRIEFAKSLYRGDRYAIEVNLCRP